VNFRSGSSVLTRESYAVLDQVAASLMRESRNPHRDRGLYRFHRPETLESAAVDGSRRSGALLSGPQSVSPMRMQARGFGASGYVAPNATLEGRAQNRRVELHKLN